MKRHRITGLPTPLNHSDAATKTWVTDDFPTKREVTAGFTMTGPWNIGNNQIYGLNDPVTNKYVDG